MTTLEILQAAKSAAVALSMLSTEQKNKALLAMADALEADADAVLSAIAEQDAEANTDNYEFLYSYLAHERRTSVVAEALHMHRNSVNYRVSRIQEQFNLDLDDPKLRFDLIVAYRLRGASFVQNAQPHFFN
jgi:DNA-binding PucR family transcriptional regulator